MTWLTCFGLLTAGHYFNDPQFSKTGQIPEALAGTSSKSISNAIQQPLATKMKLKKSDLNVPKPFLNLLNAIT